MSIDISRLKDYYVAVWRKSLSVFLGWPSERINRWIERYREDLNNYPSMFYHELPLWYVVPLLIPPKLIWRLDSREEIRLFNRILDAASSGVDTFPPELKRSGELSSLVDWLPQFKQYQQDLIQKNIWLGEANVETYDWSAAKARVVMILAEYGEELPHWEEKREST